jgi:3-oxoacyl-[acyl-carrier protein] reductase
MSKIALVTGGTRGIGASISIALKNSGCKVVATYNSNTEKANLFASDHGIDVFQWDVADSSACELGVKQVEEKLGTVDILINNAGIIRDRSFLKMTEEEWDSVINVNLKSLFIVTKSVVPHMKENGYGRIVSASSINGSAGAFGQTNYCATKAGISGFTRALCKEVGKNGITVNAVAPGFVKSVMSDSMPEEIIKAGIKMIPVGRIGTPEDMGHAYLFLASKEAGFVSGITLHANGGAMPM